MVWDVLWEDLGWGGSGSFGLSLVGSPSFGREEGAGVAGAGSAGAGVQEEQWRVGSCLLEVF